MSIIQNYTGHIVMLKSERAITFLQSTCNFSLARGPAGWHAPAMQPLLTVEDLAVTFHTRQGALRAVDGVSFQVHPGEILGVVGESGCGKSVTAFALLGLIPSPPGKIERGTARFTLSKKAPMTGRSSGRNPRDSGGTQSLARPANSFPEAGQIDLLRASESQLRQVRGAQIGLIFQDPMTSLNPYLTIGEQLIEPLQTHAKVPRKAAWEAATDALAGVGVPTPSARMRCYPHELSGGQRQRVMIAMALMLQPSLLVADEPTTALDVTVQAQILDLIEARRASQGLGVVLITHDLSVVAERCDRLLVMYAGQVMETGTTAEVFAQPRHPYTQALLRALPSANQRGQRLFSLQGGPPDLSRPLPGDPLTLRPGLTHGGRWTQERPPLIAHSATHFARASDVVLPT